MLQANSCRSCAIRHTGICSGCGANDLRLLEKARYIRSYDAGQPIAWCGDRMEFVASVMHGSVSLSQTMKDGRNQMVGLLMPPSFLGQPGQESSPYDVVAVDYTVLCCFCRNQFGDLMKEFPHLTDRLLEMSLRELDAARQWLLVLGCKLAREKTASFLAVLASREAVAKALPRTRRIAFDLTISREAIAACLGLTMETVSRQITALKNDGIIQLKSARRIVVPDVNRLLREAGDVPAAPDEGDRAISAIA
ncbi:transcriptional regulator FnrL [Leisingera sp.]|uniref:transcriptional regulator FnrL n=1 Tax=Leisingera sp. TaxID=1879318 RepID=UPI002B26F925|nr:Crp/Fnr family transcriptional regulator [Leisingera sp.]